MRLLRMGLGVFALFISSMAVGIQLVPGNTTMKVWTLNPVVDGKTISGQAFVFATSVAIDFTQMPN
jgi:hypothetical protein